VRPPRGPVISYCPERGAISPGFFKSSDIVYVPSSGMGYEYRIR
jgi:hypothetical protein